MSTPTRFTLLVGWTLAALTITVTSANAYVDAGSTQVVFQAIVAFLAAAGTGFAMFRQRIMSFFGGKRSVETAAGDTEAPDGEHV